MQVKALYGPPGPGTGKTTELLRRVQEAKDSGVSPDSIAFLSFTRAAAGEALSRLGLRRSDNVSTIHSMCFRLLGLRQPQVVDSTKLREFAAKVGVPIIGKSPEDDEERADGDAYLDIINYSRNTFTDPGEAYDLSERPGTRAEFDMFRHAYVNWKSVFGYRDFTDMLEEVARSDIRSSAEIFFIDEAQDLSPLQWRVIERAAAGAHCVTVAGDDDQAIYTWSGADPHGMARFTERHGGDSEVLSVSHRLPVAVHKKSQELIHRVSHRVDKVFTCTGHVGLVRLYGGIDSVTIRRGQDTLLLGRTHSVLRDIEQSLIEGRVPYLRQSGRPGMYQNRWANAIRAYNKLARGETLKESEKTQLLYVANTTSKQLVQDGRWSEFVARPFHTRLDIPIRALDFYMDADLDQTPSVRLSTIHASKGHEADRVILMTDMTSRVAETAAKNPDDEIRTFYVGVTRARKVLDIVEGTNGFRI